MGLLNVRLDSNLERKVKALRAEGKVAAKIVRDAINAEYERTFSSPPPRDLAKIVRDIHARYPDEPDDADSGSGVRTHIRAEATAFIRGKLKEEQRRIYNQWFADHKKSKARRTQADKH